MNHRFHFNATGKQVSWALSLDVLCFARTLGGSTRLGRWMMTTMYLHIPPFALVILENLPQKKCGYNKHDIISSRRHWGSIQACETHSQFLYDGNHTPTSVPLHRVFLLCKCSARSMHQRSNDVITQKKREKKDLIPVSTHIRMYPWISLFVYGIKLTCIGSN